MAPLLSSLKQLLAAAQLVAKRRQPSAAQGADKPVDERLNEARSQLRDPDGQLTFDVVRDLEKQLIVEGVNDGQEPHELLAVLMAVRDGGGTMSLVAFDHTDQWLNAISAALDYNAERPGVYADRAAEIESSHPRQLYVARCIKKIRDTGFALTFEDGNPTSVSELRAIEQHLAERIAKSPQLHLHALIEHLRKRYETEADRYNFLPHLSTGGDHKTEGQFPLGHLFLIIATALRDLPLTNASLSQEDVREVEDVWALYRAYAGALDLEPWSVFESLYINTPARVLRFIRERVLYEQNFAPRQQRPWVTVMMLQLLFAPFADEAFAPRLPFTVDEATRIAGAILDYRAGPGALRLSSAQIGAATSLDIERVRTVLNSFAFRAGTRDPRTVSFFDLSSGDAMYFPLIALDNDEYVLVDRLLAGPAFYEATASAYRAVLGTRFEEVMGKEGLEGAIVAALEARGVPVVHGKYEGPEGLECDAVAETPGSIALLEAKKKGLTRKSLAGDPARVLFDVSASLLAAHAQLLRHENVLLRDGQLTFCSGAKVHLSSRRIDRVAVTLLDMGSLQDKLTLGNLLTNLRGATLQLPHDADAETVKAARQFENNVKVIEEMFTANAPFVLDYERLQRFSVRSFSLGNLLELLQDVSDPASFEANLAVERHMTTGTGDWLSEFRHMKKARADHPDMYKRAGDGADNGTNA